METLFELTFQDQTLNPRVGTFTDASQATGTFTLEDGEYYLTNADTKGFYAYSPVAMQSGLVDDSKVIIEFDLKVVTASANTHAIIGTYAGVDGSGVPTGAKITLQYNAGDIELVLGGGATATLIESADVVVDQWYHFRIDCTLAAPLASTYQVKIDGVSVTTVTGATTDYALGVISVLGTDLHACDECGIKNITFVTETNMYVGRTALDQALKDVKNYVDSSGSGSYIPLAGTNALAGSIVPSTDNSYDFGSSTYKLRYVYCGTAYVTNLNVNGKTIGTDASDNMTYNGHIVDTIEEQGDEQFGGYIRYFNGLQICWGYISAGGQVTKNYPKSFSERPAVSVTVDSSDTNSIVTASSTAQAVTVYNNVGYYGSYYIAIGKWK